jgi:hypothetical protein
MRLKIMIIDGNVGDGNGDDDGDNDTLWWW